jgi:hypothetical protein
VSLGRSASSSNGSQGGGGPVGPPEGGLQIELAGPPATCVSERAAICIEIPLTGEPDELLVKELKKSPPLLSLCEDIEIGGQILVLHPNEDGLAALKTMLAAVLALIETTNRARADEAMSDEQRAAAAAEALRSEVQGELEAWWAEQRREPS